MSQDEQDDTLATHEQSFFERYSYDQWMPAPPRLVADCPRGLLQFPEHAPQSPPTSPPTSPRALYFTPPESPEPPESPAPSETPEAPEAPEAPEPPEAGACELTFTAFASAPILMRLDDFHRCTRFLNYEWTFAMCFYKHDTIVKLWRLHPKFTRMLLRSCKGIPGSRLACRDDFPWIGWPTGVLMHDVEVLLWSPQTFATKSLEAYAQRTHASKTVALPADADWFPLIQRMRQRRLEQMSTPPV